MTDFSTLEPLTRAQTITLRGMVEHVCAARGLPCTPHDHDAFQVGDAILGLANLAAHVADVPESEWIEVVDAWITNLERIRDANDSEVTEANIYPRLVRSTPPADADTDYPFVGIVPGLSMIFAADYPTHVVELLAADHFTHLGSPVEVGRIAVNNLHRLSVPEPQLVDLGIDGSSIPVVAFQFNDFFGPSRLLYAATFAQEHLSSAEHGHLVAAPTRDVLLFLPIDAEDLFDQVNVFASTVDSLYRSGPGSACEITYHLTSAGDLDAVAHLTADGRLYFRPNEDLAAKFFNLPEPEA
ncbi:hypothetical protein GCM10027289_27220 [Tsukamurella serpentis]